MELAQANLEVFAAALLELAREDPDLLVVTSDSRGSAKLAPFAKGVPGQIVEVGIAEQNLVGVAAGLAVAGKRVFAVSPACFLTARTAKTDRKSTRLNSSHTVISYAVFCLKKKKKNELHDPRAIATTDRE